MRETMHPMLVALLDQNAIEIGRRLDAAEDSPALYELLAALTGVHRDAGEIRALKAASAGYCLTGDNLLKMLAIFVRVSCAVPVVLMGECGCGKTSLVKFLCRWLGAALVVLDVHGGTREADVLGAFAEAEARVAGGGADARAYVFLDEMNAAPHVGLITEAICQRTLNGAAISPRASSCSPRSTRTAAGRSTSSSRRPGSCSAAAAARPAPRAARPTRWRRSCTACTRCRRR